MITGFLSQRTKWEFDLFFPKSVVREVMDEYGNR